MELNVQQSVYNIIQFEFLAIPKAERFIYAQASNGAPIQRSCAVTSEDIIPAIQTC